MATETQQAAADLQKKLKLEKTFRREVNSLFSRMVNDHIQRVRATGLPVDANTFFSDWRSSLRLHYTRTQNMFRGVVETRKSKQDEDDNQLDEALLLAALLAWRDGKQEEQAQLITDTNKTDILESMETARQSLLEQEEDLSNENVAVASAAVLNRKLKARRDSIVMTETQASAESTKMMEAVWLSGADPMPVTTGGLIAVTTSTKTWRTVGDDKVRDKHRKVNGQVKPLTQPFEVAGDLLMFPGDSSLGASADNVINCRCSSVHRIV